MLFLFNVSIVSHCKQAVNAAMGGATGGGDNVPATFGTSGVQGGTGGRSNENDLCFYIQQTVFIQYRYCTSDVHFSLLSY